MSRERLPTIQRSIHRLGLLLLAFLAQDAFSQMSVDVDLEKELRLGQENAIHLTMDDINHDVRGVLEGIDWGDEVSNQDRELELIELENTRFAVALAGKGDQIPAEIREQDFSFDGEGATQPALTENVGQLERGGVDRTEDQEDRDIVTPEPEFGLSAGENSEGESQPDVEAVVTEDSTGSAEIEETAERAETTVVEDADIEVPDTYEVSEEGKFYYRSQEYIKAYLGGDEEFRAHGWFMWDLVGGLRESEELTMTEARRIVRDLDHLPGPGLEQTLTLDLVHQDVEFKVILKRRVLMGSFSPVEVQNPETGETRLVMGFSDPEIRADRGLIDSSTMQDEVSWTVLQEGNEVDVTDEQLSYLLATGSQVHTTVDLNIPIRIQSIFAEYAEEDLMVVPFNEIDIARYPDTWGSVEQIADNLQEYSPVEAALSDVDFGDVLSDLVSNRIEEMEDEDDDDDEASTQLEELHSIKEIEGLMIQSIEADFYLNSDRNATYSIGTTWQDREGQLTTLSLTETFDGKEWSGEAIQIHQDGSIGVVDRNLDNPNVFTIEDLVPHLLETEDEGKSYFTHFADFSQKSDRSETFTSDGMNAGERYQYGVFLGQDW